MSPPNEDDFFFGNGTFTMANGDTYTGDYVAHKRGIIWREGIGTYNTNDGQIYEAQWLNDGIVEDVPIKIYFPNGDEYHGPTTQHKLSGPGTYVFDNKLSISCVFQDNKPSGEIVLIDLDGRTWKGSPLSNDRAVLLPDNHFYYLIPENLGVGELKTKYRKDSKLKKCLCLEGDSRKGSKSKPVCDFTDSKWYQRYLRYEAMFNCITEKLKNEEELTEEEKKWYAKSLKNRREVKLKHIREKAEKKKLAAVDTSLLETFQSKEFKKRWPAMKVLYPNVTDVTYTEIE